MFEIIPGINEVEWGEIEKKIELALPFAKTIHIDLMDGILVDRKTFFDPSPFKKYTDKALFEVHMMVDNPAQYLQPFAEAGFERFLGHVEKMPDMNEFVAQGQLLGAVGLAIDKDTPLSVLDKLNLMDLDTILVMTIKAGQSGQEFEPELLEKVRELNQKARFLPIEVDGGINDETVMNAYKAGATRFVSTTHIFGSQNPEDTYRKLHSQINPLS